MWNKKSDENIILNLIKNKKVENQYYERKSGSIQPKDLAKQISGFANANGGYIVIGVNDSGDIDGINRYGDEKINKLICSWVNSLENEPEGNWFLTDIINQNGEKDRILIFDVKTSSNRVIRMKNGEVYLRIADITKSLTHDEILNLEYDKGERYFEEKIERRATVEDLDEESLNQYLEKLHTNQSTLDILSARGLVFFENEKTYLTNACIILFAKYPAKFLPNARVKFIRYEGTDALVGTEMNMIKNIEVDKPLVLAVEELKNIVSSQLRDFGYLDSDTGKFITVPEYPEFSWQEGIVNALIHRDYSIVGDYIKVIMFDDRLEIMSPGSLPNIVRLDNLINTRYARNPKIARVMCDFGWARELNEGVKRIYKEMQDFYLEPPIYSENLNSLKLSLKNNYIMRSRRVLEQIKKNIPNSIWENLTDYEKIALKFINQNGSIKVSTLKDLTGKSASTCQKILKNLVQLNILEWHGASSTDPTQYYDIAKSKR